MYRTLRDSLGRVGRWPRLLALTACLLLAVASAVGAVHRSAPATARAQGHAVPVVVATRDLAAGRVLVARDLSIARWPPQVRPPGAASRVGSRVGDRLAGPVRAGEPVTATRVVGAALTDGLAPGVAAVPISVADPHAAELVRPGEKVELLATPRDDADLGNGPSGAVSVVARRLLVLAALPGTDEASSSLVVAANPAATLAIARAQSAGILLAVPVAP